MITIKSNSPRKSVLRRVNLNLSKFHIITPHLLMYNSLSSSQLSKAAFIIILTLTVSLHLKTIKISWIKQWVCNNSGRTQFPAVNSKIPLKSETAKEDLYLQLNEALKRNRASKKQAKGISSTIFLLDIFNKNKINISIFQFFNLAQKCHSLLPKKLNLPAVFSLNLQIHS